MEGEEKKQIRSFAIALAVVLTIFGSLPVIKGKSPIVWLYAIAVIAFGLGLGLPVVLRPVFKVWMLIAKALGIFNTYLFLSLIYILIFSPIGLVLRLLGKDFLDRKIEKGKPSYWKPYEEPKSTEEYYHQF